MSSKFIFTFLKWLTFTVFFGASLVVHSAELRPLALVYNGPGVCSGCPQSLGKLIEHSGYRVRYIQPHQLTKSALQEAKLFVHPGGTDRMEDTLEALPGYATLLLRNFVSQGGKYLGVCAGGYLAGTWTDEDHKIAAFGFIPGHVEREMNDDEAHVVPVTWANKAVWLYYQGGPTFDITGITGAQVWARYRDSNSVAAFMAPFGKGRIGLIGPHVEATKDWYEEDHLQIVDGVHLNLGIQFIKAL